MAMNVNGWPTTVTTAATPVVASGVVDIGETLTFEAKGAFSRGTGGSIDRRPR